MVQTPASTETVFRLLRELPETTRTDIVARTGLSKATVSETISQLLASGLVAEVGKWQPGRGRRQVLLNLRPESRLVIGAEFNEQGCHAVLSDLRAGPLIHVGQSFSSTDPEVFVTALEACVAEILPQAPSPVLGVGIGVPGVVDAASRNVAVSVPFNWRDVPIAQMVERRTGLPTTIANRAKAAALGEYWQGSGTNPAGRRHLAYITVGAGIVAGFVIDGELYNGHVGAAGELGHTTVDPTGPLCGCGNHGCLYMFASESAIIRDVEESRASLPDHVRVAQPPLPVDRQLTMADLTDALREGHPLVVGSLERAARYLGIATGNLINIMNPSHVVIGGSVAAFGDPLLIPLRAEIQRRSLWQAQKQLEITPSVLGEKVGPVGAAALFLSRTSTGWIIRGGPPGTVPER